MAESNVDYRANIHLHGNQIIQATPEVVTEDPTSDLFAGRMVFNSAEGRLKVYDGEGWTTASGTTGDGDGEYQEKSEKDQAGGYAGLDGNAKVAVAELPVGNTEGTVPLIGAEIGDGQTLVYDAEAGSFKGGNASAAGTSRNVVQITGDGSTTSWTYDGYKVTDISELPVVTLYDTSDFTVVYAGVAATADGITITMNSPPESGKSFALVVTW